MKLTTAFKDLVNFHKLSLSLSIVLTISFTAFSSTAFSSLQTHEESVDDVNKPKNLKRTLSKDNDEEKQEQEDTNLKPFDERALSGIQDHLSGTLLEWGKTTSKEPVENDISKNILKIGLYVADQKDKQWTFYNEENELYISGYCENGDPRNVPKGRMYEALKKIDKVQAFNKKNWKTLKEKKFEDLKKDFSLRNVDLGDKFNLTPFSTTYGHTEQAFLSNLLEIKNFKDSSDRKAVIVMSSSNIPCDNCSPSLTYSMYNPDFRLKDRAIAYFENCKSTQQIADGNLEKNWNTIPDVSIIFSSYSYALKSSSNSNNSKKAKVMGQVGHNKGYFFP